jgi:hypothetical protein
MVVDPEECLAPQVHRSAFWQFLDPLIPGVAAVFSEPDTGAAP